MQRYPHRRTITTRWMDNDVYGHVNNVQYYSYFDTVINEYLIAEGGLDIGAGDVIGLCAESHCAFHGAARVPGHGRGVACASPTSGRSSVRYEIALRREGAAELGGRRAGSSTCSSTARRAGRPRSPTACAARWRRCSSSRPAASG